MADFFFSTALSPPRHTERSSYVPRHPRGPARVTSCSSGARTRKGEAAARAALSPRALRGPPHRRGPAAAPAAPPASLLRQKITHGASVRPRGRSPRGGAAGSILLPFTAGLCYFRCGGTRVTRRKQRNRRAPPSPDDVIASRQRVVPPSSDGSRAGGMLLELPAPGLDQMSDGEKPLSAGLQKALSTLQDSTEKCLFQTVEDETDSDSTDSLGDQLYDLVDVHGTGHSEKITGMLLELGRNEVKKLVSDPQLLEQKIHVAQEALEQELLRETGASDLDCDNVKERLGEKIFERVEKIDPENCAYITGMLLELDPSAIRMLLTDSSALKGAVQRAQAALPQAAAHRSSDPDPNNEEGSDLDSETENLGEELYCYINSTKYSQHSSKITGMLLEMPHASLVELLKSPEQLNEKIQVAAAALKDS
ncbi:uncharacterized protein LOC127582268 [Pristis pectinata]|uniref:uncharacterized protein LOC127582268 n=1 Tax=Pristis pectinata TaxID=685728 RepID=UPI00223CEA2D|nr:uncharacterized protein LOC127582268 [Pristis pectinata]